VAFLAAKWRSFEGWVGSRSSVVALLLVALAVFALESVFVPAYPGRDMVRYIQTYFQLGYDVPVYPAVLNTRGPLSALGVALPLEAGGWVAEIFLAYQVDGEGLERPVVIKRIRPHLSKHATFVKMFLNEARLAAQLNHPNIVQIHDLGKIGESYFIAMEYIFGRDMRRPRFEKSLLRASYSTAFQPSPTPRRNRPPVSMSTSAACLATSAVCRCGRMMIPVTSSSVVSAAT